MINVCRASDSCDKTCSKIRPYSPEKYIFLSQYLHVCCEREREGKRKMGGIEIEKERNREREREVERGRDREIVKVHKHVSSSVSPLQSLQRYRDGQDR